MKVSEDKQKVLNLWEAGDEANMELAWVMTEYTEGVDHWELYWARIVKGMNEGKDKIEKEFNFVKSMLGQGGTWISITFLGVVMRIVEEKERMVMQVTFNEDFDENIALFNTGAGLGWKTEKDFDVKFNKVLGAMEKPLKEVFDDRLNAMILEWLKGENEEEE